MSLCTMSLWTCYDFKWSLDHRNKSIATSYKATSLSCHWGAHRFLLLSSLSAASPGRLRSGSGFRRSRRCPASTTTASTPRTTGWRGQRISHQLGRRSGSCVCGDRKEDELPSLVDVSHRNSGLHSRHGHLRDIFSGLLVVGVEHRIRAIA